MIKITAIADGVETTVESSGDTIDRRHNIILEIAVLRSRLLGGATIQEANDALLAIRKAGK